MCFQMRRSAFNPTQTSRTALNFCEIFSLKFFSKKKDKILIYYSTPSREENKHCENGRVDRR